MKRKIRKSRPKPAKVAAPLKRIVVTIDLEQDSIVKVETMESSGEHRTLSDEELAALSGVDDLQDLTAALEDAYADGITDGLEYAEELRLQGIEPEEVEEALLQSSQIIAGSRRQFLFRRILRRSPTTKTMRSDHNGAHKAH